MSSFYQEDIWFSLTIINLLSKKEDNVKQEPIVITGSETGDKLADIDLVKIPCSKEYIESNSDMLCRELFCRMQQRGIDSKTSSADCASISNMNNSIQFIEIITKNIINIIF